MSHHTQWLQTATALASTSRTVALEASATAAGAAPKSEEPSLELLDSTFENQYAGTAARSATAKTAEPSVERSVPQPESTAELFAAPAHSSPSPVPQSLRPAAAEAASSPELFPDDSGATDEPPADAHAPSTAIQPGQNAASQGRDEHATLRSHASANPPPTPLLFPESQPRLFRPASANPPTMLSHQPEPDDDLVRVSTAGARRA